MNKLYKWIVLQRSDWADEFGATCVKDWGRWDKKGNFLEEDAGRVEENNTDVLFWRTCRVSG